jgi:hypothetical protein
VSCFAIVIAIILNSIPFKEITIVGASRRLFGNNFIVLLKISLKL